MPQIPRGQDIDRVTPSGQQPIVREDTRYAGAVMGEIARAGVEFLDRRTNVELAQAQAEFLTSKVQQDSAFDQDKDYATIPDRYTEGVQIGLNKAASVIKSPAARAAFLQSAQVDVARGQERIKGVAWQKEVEHQQAYLGEKLVVMREAGLTGDVQSTAAAAQDLITSYVAAGYITAVQGGDTFRAWRDDMVVAKIESMDPESRIEALSAPFAGNIPSDVRVKLRRAADEELDDQFAVDTVTAWTAEGVTPDVAATRFPAITDARRRARTESRYNLEWLRAEQELNRSKTNLMDDLFDQVRSGQLAVADIPAEQRDLLGSDIGVLYNAETQVASGTVPVQSDISVLYTLDQLLANPRTDPLVVDEYYRENIASLGVSDQKLYSKAVNDNLFPEEKLLLSNTQYITARVRAANPDPRGADGSDRARASSLREQQIAAVQLSTMDWMKSQTDLTGKAPTQPEIQKYLDAQFMELVYQPARDTWMPFDERPEKSLTWQAMDADQRVAAVGILRDTQPVVYQSVLNVLGVSEIANPSDFIEAYQYVYDTDNASR